MDARKIDLTPPPDHVLYTQRAARLVALVGLIFIGVLLAFTQ